MTNEVAVEQLPRDVLRSGSVIDSRPAVTSTDTERNWLATHNVPSDEFSTDLDGDRLPTGHNRILRVLICNRLQRDSSQSSGASEVQKSGLLVEEPYNGLLVLRRSLVKALIRNA